MGQRAANDLRGALGGSGAVGEGGESSSQSLCVPQPGQGVTEHAGESHATCFTIQQRPRLINEKIIMFSWSFFFNVAQSSFL